MTTTDDLVPEQLWQAIQPLMPHPTTRYGGRPRIDDRACLAGIVDQLRTGVPWRLLPVRELGCGSGVTCWRRLRDWQRAGVWQRLQQLLLDQLGRDGRLDWSRASLDSLERARQAGGCLTGPNPTDRGKPGSKYHLLVDRGGIPLTVCLSAANTHDSMLLEGRGGCGCAGQGAARSSRAAAQAPGQAPPGQGRRRPTLPPGAAPAGIIPRIARRGIESSGRPGRHRYVGERSLAWLVGCGSAMSGAPTSCWVPSPCLCADLPQIPESATGMKQALIYL